LRRRNEKNAENRRFSKNYMQNQCLKKSMEIGGRTLTLETGRMAKQASGAVFTVYGDTMVLATVTGTTEPREGKTTLSIVEFG
jgi:hypothetical protein